MHRESTSVTASSKQSSRAARAGESRQTGKHLQPGATDKSKQTFKKHDRPSYAIARISPQVHQSALISEIKGPELEPTLQLEPTQDLGPTDFHKWTKRTNDIEPTLELEPTQLFDDMEPSRLVPEMPATQDVGISQTFPSTQLLQPPSQDLADDPGIKEPQALEGLSKLWSTVQHQSQGRAVANLAQGGRNEHRSKNRNHGSSVTARHGHDDQISSNRKAMKTGSKERHNAVVGLGLGVPDSVTNPVLERYTKKVRVHHSTASLTPVPTQTLEIEAMQHMSPEYISSTSTRKATCQKVKQVVNHSMKKKHAAQETESVAFVPDRTPDFIPTQHLSPEHVAMTQQLTPTQELKPLRHSSLMQREDMKTTHVGLFGRSTALYRNPLVSASGVLPVKRSFTDFVRLGRKNRSRMFVEESPQPAEKNRIEIAALNDKSSEVHPPELEAATRIVHGVAPAEVQSQTISLEVATQVDSGDSHIVVGDSSTIKSDVASLRPEACETKKFESNHEESRHLGTHGHIAETAAKTTRNGVATGSERNAAIQEKIVSEEFAIPDNVMQVEEVVPNLSGAAHSGNSGFHSSSNSHLPLAAGTAPNPHSHKDPLQSIIEELAAQGLQRVVAAEELARQLAEQQRTVAGVFRALMALIPTQP